MQVLTVANQKGGVGKTTTAVTLGGLAAEQRHKVLLIDLDPHGSMTCYFGQNPDTLVESVFTLFQERQSLNYARVSQLIMATQYDNISLFPASTALATLERHAVGQDGMGLVLSKALALVNNDFDYVMVDCPPLIGVLMINAVAACQRLLIPVQTEFLALKGLERMLHTLGMLTRSLKHEVPSLIVPTLFDRRTQASVGSLRVLRNTYGEQVWAGKIPIDTKFRDASKAGVPANLFEPASRGVESYKSLFKWVNSHPGYQPEALSKV